MVSRQNGNWVTGDALKPYLRGAPFLSLEDGRARVHRLDPTQRAYPVDMWEHARTSSGVRLEFRCTAPEVRFRLRYVEVRARPEASLWQGATRLAVFNPNGKTGDHEARFALPPGGGPFTLYLPYNSVVELGGIAPAEALQPAPEPSRRWVAFGDSITHGWNATDPGGTYPAIAARRLGVDHFNLGFAGAARGEPSVAETLGAIPGDVFSLAFGTNLMRRGWYDHIAWRHVFRTFLELLRTGHPDTPVLVVSPIYRALGNAEVTPSPRGMTQRELRAIEEEVVRIKQQLGDRNLRLLSGLDVLTERDAGLLSDGLHPDDQGMEVMARNLAPHLAPLLEGPA